MNVSIDARALSSVSSVLPINGRNGSLTTIQANSVNRRLCLRTRSKALNIECEIALEADVTEDGVALVSTDGFRDVTRKSSGVATMRMEDSRLIYTDDTCTIRLGVSSKSQEDLLPTTRPSGVVSAQLLAKALRLGRCAGPNDDDKDTINKYGCVQLLLHGHQLEVGSTDGPRLALATTAAKVDSAMSESISDEQAAWLSKALSLEEDRLVQIGVEGGSLAIRGSVLGARLLTMAKQLPDWRKSIPPAQPCKISIKPGDLHNAIDRLKAIAPNTVEIRIGARGMVIAGANEHGSGDGEIRIDALKSDTEILPGKIRVQTNALSAWDRAVAQSSISDSVDIEFGREQNGVKLPATLRAGCATLIVTPMTG